MRYAVIIEPTGQNYSGFVPDLPGCIATGATSGEVEARLREAIRFHLDGMIEDGTSIPPAKTIAEYIEA